MRSRKYLSWVTISNVTFERERKFSSHSMVGMSRWLVGSSRISRSGWSAITRAMARRLRCPPESVSMRASDSYTSICVSNRFRRSSPPVKSPTVIPSGRSGVCSRKPIFKSLRGVIFPESTLSEPAMQRSSVVFPVPFLAISAILSPWFIPNVTSENIIRSPWLFVRFSIWR